VSYRDKSCLVMTEEINQRRFRTVTENRNLTDFDEIIICAEKDFDTEFYRRYTDRITIVNRNEEVERDYFTLTSQIEKRNMVYILKTGELTVGFNHKRADLTDYDIDIYFFGSDTPSEVNADYYFYFSPVIKANTEMVSDKEAAELYDMLTIKSDISSGRYTIIKDVKNFGSKL
ncbi:MAG: hypothetical protein IJD80_02330, partial [Oscillospiraceae bacterium]|nr:hypothetical protein [Oscillospiraceae bacterium]